MPTLAPLTTARWPLRSRLIHPPRTTGDSKLSGTVTSVPLSRAPEGFLDDGRITVVSFDIDGTMEFGDPPGPIPVAMAKAMAELGHVIGSGSDRTRSDQANLWDAHGVDVQFVGGKHHLPEV